MAQSTERSERSHLSDSIIFLYFFLHWSLRKAFLSLLAILWNSAFKWVYLSFSPLLFASLLFTAICKASSDSHFAFFAFLRSVYQGNRNKSKNKQIGPNQTYKLLHSKGNHKHNEETTYRMGEDTTNDVTHKGLISKIYRQLIQLNIKKPQTTQSKNGQKT